MTLARSRYQPDPFALRKFGEVFWDSLNDLARTFFVGTAVASGTSNAPLTSVGQKNHPGMVRIRSSTSANSGFSILANPTARLFGGGEFFECSLRIETIANTTIRFGYLDTSSSADSTDGAYFEIVGGNAVGKTATAASRSTTGTFVMSAATWYRCRLEMAFGAASVTFNIADEGGGILFSEALTTDIPTTDGNEFGMGLVATNSGTTALDLCNVDYLWLGSNRILTR